ncbi:MAG: SPFH domain-containing protein [Acidobacteria bacterium]|nr:SPFH domain-containing protein [Acidobacteriota bacterium]
MGIMDRIMGQFIEVIEWVDDSPDTMVYRFPVYSKEIKMGAQLTVRETQAAVFLNEGVVADVFAPGRYTLSTQNMPIMTTLRSWKYGFNSPFKADVFFVNTRQFTDLKWGTANPVMMRDKEFGMLRLRAFGIYSMRINDPKKFYTEIAGTRGLFTTEEISEQMRKAIISSFSDLLAESGIPALDLATRYDELSLAAREKLTAEFGTYGLELAKFYVENISLPEEVERMLDKRTQMGIVGDLRAFTQFQAATSMEEAALNPSGGGAAGAGVGLGAGLAMAQAMNQAYAAQPAAPAGVKCASCQAVIPEGSKFCPGCGKPSAQPSTAPCAKCGAAVPTGSKFCPGCGTAVASKCPACQADVAAGTKFCASCGQKI